MQKKEITSTSLEDLPEDPFLIVQNLIILTVEMIGGPDAIPALQGIANNHSFRNKRFWAIQTIVHLSQV